MSSSKRTINYQLDLSIKLFEKESDIFLKIISENLDKFQSDREDLLLKMMLKKPGENLISKSSEAHNIDWIFLNSIYVSMIMSFENTLFKVASYVEKKLQSRIKIQDINGSGYIDQYRKFLELVGDIESASINSSWKEIFFYRDVRNKLIHETGKLTTNPEKDIRNFPLTSFLLNHEVLVLSPIGMIRIVNKKIFEAFIALTKELFQKLEKEINEKTS